MRVRGEGEEGELVTSDGIGSLRQRREWAKEENVTILMAV